MPVITTLSQVLIPISYNKRLPNPKNHLRKLSNLHEIKLVKPFVTTRLTRSSLIRWGDVPMEKGVCTDVVIRALREQNIDLQELVHQDMSRNFSVYPKRWGLKQPDTNIDHRRVPNLMTYFTRQGLGRSRYKLSSWRYCNLGTKRKPSPYRHCLRSKNRR